MIIERNISFDIVRILACMAVIMIHTAGSPIVHGLVKIGTIEYNECLVLDALCRWSVPVFAMLTGFFMLDPSKNITINVLYRKYILRLFTSLVFWSLFYAFTLHKSLYPLGIQEGHFWYVGMCIGLYMAIPVMRLLVSYAHVLKYFCWTWFAVKVYQFLGHYVTLPIDLRDVIFVDYVGYCLFAYYLKTLSQIKLARKIFYILGLLGIGVTIAVGVLTKDDNTVFYGYTAPNVIVIAISIFVFFLNRSIKLSTAVTQKISVVSQCTFGIYMVHLWILVHVFSRFHRFISHLVPLCLICVIFSFLAGFIITYAIKRIPYVGKYIV